LPYTESNVIALHQVHYSSSAMMQQPLWASLALRSQPAFDSSRHHRSMILNAKRHGRLSADTVEKSGCTPDPRALCLRPSLPTSYGQPAKLSHPRPASTNQARWPPCDGQSLSAGHYAPTGIATATRTMSPTISPISRPGACRATLPALRSTPGGMPSAANVLSGVDSTPTQVQSPC
jgi:hypothetical protein